MDRILQRCVLWCGGVTSHVSSEPNGLMANRPERMENVALKRKKTNKKLLSSALEINLLGSYNLENPNLQSLLLIVLLSQGKKANC